MKLAPETYDVFGSSALSVVSVNAVQDLHGIGGELTERKPSDGKPEFEWAISTVIEADARLVGKKKMLILRLGSARLAVRSDQRWCPARGVMKQDSGHIFSKLDHYGLEDTCIGLDTQILLSALESFVWRSPMMKAF